MPKPIVAETSPLSIADKRRMQMADIARLAGVSTSTVSRALSGSPLVNEETRRRIEELAKSLNYSVNVGAQNLRLGQNRTVAVVVPFDSLKRQHLSDPFFLSLLGSIADALTDRGLDMLLTRVDSEKLYAAAQAYETGRAIGVILIGQWRHHDQLNQLAARQIPIVVWGAQLPQQLYATVGSDNVTGGFLATEHLIKTGRKHIAFFGDIQLPEVAHRHDGYCKALAKHGIAYDETLIVNASFLEGAGRLAIEELKARHAKYDGLFACSDLLATSAIGKLRDDKKRVPEHVAVVGYDDIELARNFHPSLTTIRQPIDKAGELLIETLLELVENHVASPRLLPTQLIKRETSAIPARNSGFEIAG
ncbi:MAG TPA: LacI family DNA-binding transcriptional regulator [Burkholderiaceae bacterium]|jgi:DNA-binding LacI/PurR family transcriptional regulator